MTLYKITEEPVSGVKAVTVNGGDTAISDKKGRLVLQVPEHYKDSVLMIKDGYSSFKTRIHSVPPGKYYPVYLTPTTAPSVYSSIYISHKGNDLVVGQVFNANYKEPLEHATISLNDGSMIIYSDRKGKYEFDRDKAKEDSMNISCEGFQSRNIPIKRINNTGLLPLGKTEREAFKDQYKNAVSLSVLELFRGAVALRYERLLPANQSIGLHTSIYFFNKNIETELILFSDILEISQFDGIKIAPFYRYYLWRRLHFAGFCEAKPIFGYFSFPDFNKNYTPDNEHVDFFTGGAAAAFGFMINSGHFITNISIGGQYFPVTKSLPAAASGREDDNWWYGCGPGAYFEFKMTIGGFF